MFECEEWCIAFILLSFFAMQDVHVAASAYCMTVLFIVLEGRLYQVAVVLGEEEEEERRGWRRRKWRMEDNNIQSTYYPSITHPRFLIPGGQTPAIWMCTTRLSSHLSTHPPPQTRACLPECLLLLDVVTISPALHVKAETVLSLTSLHWFLQLRCLLWHLLPVQLLAMEGLCISTVEVFSQILRFHWTQLHSHPA